MAKKLATAKRASARGEGASARQGSMQATSVETQSLHLSHWERSDRESDPGEGLRTIDEPSPPHPNPLPDGERGHSGTCRATPKRKGGPVIGTPSPMRTKLSPELQADARRRFEQTEEFGSSIAADCGVDESVIRRMALREGWVRFVAPPRDLPPMAKLLAEVEALEAGMKAELLLLSLPPPSARLRASSTRYGGGEGRFDEHQRDEAGGGEASSTSQAPSGPQPLSPPTPNPSPPREGRAGGGEQVALAGGGEKEENIARFIRVVMAHLDEFEVMRCDGKLKPTQYLAVARGISILTEAFNKLQRLRAAQPGQSHDTISDSYTAPADTDAFCEALAQRIENFLASRTDADAFGEPDAEREAGVA
ncbi:MAG: hypothetical protein Q7T81_06910 [Pseudolabrys sp.]|nr:hypothetical protein [Pseudolabrys sp.]